MSLIPLDVDLDLSASLPLGASPRGDLMDRSRSAGRASAAVGASAPPVADADGSGRAAGDRAAAAPALREDSPELRLGASAGCASLERLPVELRNLDGGLLANIVVDPDASMGQFMAKLRAAGVAADLLQRFVSEGQLVLLRSAESGVRGETLWPMSRSYSRPVVGPCARAELAAGRPLVFQVVLSSPTPR